MTQNIIAYKLIRSKRKTLMIRITESADLEVRAPKHVSVKQIEQFVQSKKSWIEMYLQKARQIAHARHLACPDEAEMAARIEELKRLARDTLPQRTQTLSALVGVQPRVVSISSAQKRWGSCSAGGRINLSWRLMRLPQALCDYVIIHELCHLLEMNHSKSFWREVERCMPDYRERRERLILWQEKLLLEGW